MARRPPHPGGHCRPPRGRRPPGWCPPADRSAARRRSQLLYAPYTGCGPFPRRSETGRRDHISEGCCGTAGGRRRGPSSRSTRRLPRRATVWNRLRARCCGGRGSGGRRRYRREPRRMGWSPVRCWLSSGTPWQIRRRNTSRVPDGLGPPPCRRRYCRRGRW